MSVERTLVLGAAGGVGLAVARRLRRAGREVIAGRRWDGDAEPLRRSGIASEVVDVEERESLIPVVASCNHIVYSMTPDPSVDRATYMSRSVRAIRNVLDVVREEEIERLVVTSTAATLGKPDAGEEDEADEESVYMPGTSSDKFVEAAWAVEQECRREAADGRFVVILNPSVILGEGTELPAREEIDADSDAAVNWVGLERVADAHAAALASARPGERYIVAGENGRLRELYRRAKDMDGCTVREKRSRWGRRETRAADRWRYLLANGRPLDDQKSRYVLGL